MKPIYYLAPFVTFKVVRETATPYHVVADSPDAIVSVFRKVIPDDGVEHIAVALLSKGHKVLGVARLAIGTVDVAPLAPREVAKTALLLNASACILAHSHPSGEPLPSSHDDLLTVAVSDALKTVGVALLDHLVICHEPVLHYSYRDHARMHTSLSQSNST
jgi:DNA repair protein RadC